ncbi:MAG: flagellar hook-associated protein FlgL [Anaeromicrobium sp.]|uniref:flagellar hook-associated protein FlgL n=1 Tax=Anaeromicrobium sp. TaxID=1929132 RepID=UPI0025E0B039|nr:flagellar hook-associated protein FlgL [Anaeromicrobium sp.]MCT4595414.1 flagellar hook-associated protein FlgL [Anaeromicrobium sp.]
MRITNNMMISNMMRNLNNHMINMDKLDNQASTGKRINKPSDDPVGMSTVLRLSSDISGHEQYKKNIDESLSWLDASETAITQLKDALQRVRELTVRASNGTLTAEDRAATKKEISQLKEQIISIGNTNFAGKFLFSGYNTLDEPFEEVEVTIDGKTVKRLKYNGKFLSPGGAVDPSIDDTKFKEFLLNKLNKELTSKELEQDKLIEIGTRNYMDVNITGDELVQIGFLGTYDTLTRLEMALDKSDSENSVFYKEGFVESDFGTDKVSGSIDYTNVNTFKTFSINIGEDTIKIELPKGAITVADIQAEIDKNEFLKNKGIKVIKDGADVKFTGNVEFSVEAKELSTYKVNITSPDLDNASGNKKIIIDGIELNLPKKALTTGDIQTAIDSHKELKDKNIKVNGSLNFEGDEEFKIEGNIGSSGANISETGTQTVEHSANEASKYRISPIVVGDKLEGIMESPVGGISFNVDGNLIKIPMGTYNMDTLSGRNKLVGIIQDQLKAASSNVKVKMTDDNRIMFIGDKKEPTGTFNDFTVTSTTKLGFAVDTTSDKAVVKKQELETTDILGDIDKNMTNILSIISDIGGKTNRLELDQKRTEDNILNFNKLLSKTQDVDMAETIMKMKMEESVYRAALSIGAKIIQPSLLDFIK